MFVSYREEEYLNEKELSLLNKLPRVPKRPIARVPECLECLSAQEPKCSKCPSVWVPKCLSALSAQVPKCLSVLNVRVPKYLKCRSAAVPECPPSAQVLSKCPNTLWVLSECPSARVLSQCSPSALNVQASFSVFKCTSRACMSKNMWLEQNAKHKNMFHVKRKKCKKKKMVEKNLRSLIWKQYQSADLKSFWNCFGISDLCKDFCENFAFCMGTFMRNFRLALMILTLTFSKKRSSKINFKQIIRKF